MFADGVCKELKHGKKKRQVETFHSHFQVKSCGSRTMSNCLHELNFRTGIVKGQPKIKNTDFSSYL